MGLLVFETLEIHFLPHHSRSDAPLRSLFYAPGAADRPSAIGRGPARSGHVWTAGVLQIEHRIFLFPIEPLGSTCFFFFLFRNIHLNKFKLRSKQLHMWSCQGIFATL